jgi:hypothetical protein
VDANAAFIAYANPATLTALLDALEGAEGACCCRWELGSDYTKPLQECLVHGEMRRRIEQAETALAAMTQAREEARVENERLAAQLAEWQALGPFDYVASKCGTEGLP